ncbi:hypothetical protein CKALI_11260 [Corynebacterium kalinowskii]|uniref:Phage tail protein n=1 Tax=Corynebacterium kalinowskii TaxID=2675216 RepID=A0A6B8VWL3_9CORY|nr:phage tail protein [Corynebacterium kalinowskii]QGU03096.1 hypothetical protein CKALI_11260 [Corynebacterium kalinowskii]
MKRPSWDHSAQIIIKGVNGATWHVSGPECGREGVELAEDPDGLHDEAPFKGIWQSGAFQDGASFLGYTVDPIDLVLGFDIFPEEQSWEYIEAMFYASFSPEKQSEIVFNSDGEQRSLFVQKLEKTRTTSKKDPRLLQWSKMLLTLRAKNPFWQGDTITRNLAFDSTGTKQIIVENPTDTAMWLQWVVTAPGKWTLPDNDLTGEADRYRYIHTPPLSSGQDLTIDTHPLHESYVAADGSNVAGRFNGVEFLYPIPPHTPPTALDIGYTGDQPGACQVRMVQQWQRPWGGRVQ